jgi:HPt (histidine-containing phosphotransfer) domain-containing protein
MAGSGLYEAPLRVQPDAEIADLVPEYLQRRHADVVALGDALLAGDAGRVQALGHSMKGSGGGYGFDGISEIGLRLEDAGKRSDMTAARTAVEDLADYLRNLEVSDG